jgi:hypothetical protein
MIQQSTFFEQTWDGIEWSAWYPFTRTYVAKFPSQLGMYRLRITGSQELFYVGTASTVGLGPYLRGLHSAATRDHAQMPYGGVEPWDYLAAPALWAWHDAEQSSFECSVSPIDATRQNIEGLACTLLWQYRRERRESPCANFGRFHPRYRASETIVTTHGHQRLRGRRLPEGETNPAAGASLPPTHPLAIQRMSDTYWMGLRWGGWVDLPATDTPTRSAALPHWPAVYTVANALTWEEVLYVGYARDINEAHTFLARRQWDCPSTALRAYMDFEQSVPDHRLRELVGDLVGGYFSVRREPPRLQF